MNKKIVSFIMAVSILCSVGYADAEEIPTTPDKQILYSDDFSGDLSAWNDNSDFYVLNKQLMFKNTEKSRESSMMLSSAYEIENGEIEFDLSAENGNYFALLFRAENENNHYALRFYYKNNKVVLLKRLKGSSYKTIINKSFPLEYGKNNRIGVSLVGSDMTVRIDGENVLTAKDTSIKSGTVGFEGYSIKAAVDNLEIFKFSNIDYDKKEIDENIKETKVIYVSTAGNDTTADGSENNPYATIDEARKKANSLKKGNTPVDIVFKEGTYKVSEPISLGAKDSGADNAPIRYIANEGDKVVFSGAKQINVTNFKPVKDINVRSRMYKEVQDKVLEIDLKAEGLTEDDVNFTKYYEQCIHANLKPVQIFLNNQVQKISRWPNSGYNIIEECEPGDVRNGGNKNNGGTIYYKGTQPERWLGAKDIFLEGFFCHAWAGEWARLKGIDTVNNGLNFEFSTYYGIAPDNRWAAVHLLEEIDIPGEWFIDFDKMTLYYYPTKELTDDDVFEITTLKTNLLDIKGAENIEFRGIEFSKIATDPSIMATNQNSGNALNIQNSKNILIKDCVINHVGGSGIYISSEDVTIDGCVIHDIGFSGINIAKAGNKETLMPSNVEVKNCEITDVCRNTGNNTYAGITFGTNTVGIQIKNNIIHNCANSAIRGNGIGHSIAYNEIHNSVNKTSDAGAVYFGRYWSQYGTVTEYNYFHGIGDRNTIAPYQASSMFWDDHHSGNEFSHNISVMQNYIKTSHVKMGGGIDNVITGNTFVSALMGINAEDRGSTSRDFREYSVSTLRYGEVNRNDPVIMRKYPKMCTIYERLVADDGTLKMENTIGNNLMVDNEETLRMASTVAAANTLQPANNVDAGKDFSIFVDPENQDYRVKKEAKEKYGISDEVLDEDFDINLIGIQKEYKIADENMKTVMLYPENGATEIVKAKAQIAWTKAALADGYRYTVAKDPNFKDVVIDANTFETSVSLTGLENNTTYYWKVSAYNESRQIGCKFEAEGGVWSFKTAEHEVLDKKGLEKETKRLVEVIPTIKEGNKPGEYRIGTVSTLKETLAKANEYMARSYGDQEEIDDFAYSINKMVSGVDAYINPGYTTLNLTEKSDWYPVKKSTVITPLKDKVTITNTENTEVTLKETLSNYNVMCFRTKVDSLDGWIAYGLRALNENVEIYGQDAYYILIKKDIFELQKHGTIYARAENNGKFEPGKWYDIQFGSITTENGINMYFKLNDEVIFDYLDKNEPQYEPGMFAMFIAGANTVELETAKNVSKDMYVMSDEIKAEINKVGGSAVVLDSGNKYTETGNWEERKDIKGFENSTVRTTKDKDATATWAMESGSKGNSKIFKVSYYHIPSETGDKNVNVHLFGYAGEYDTTIDLSKGEEGWAEIGTFIFQDADAIGRLSISFTTSGEGEMNLSNIKFEEVTDGTNMLK